MSARLATPLSRLLHRRLRNLQAAGIRSARYCLNAEMSLTKDSFDRIGKTFERVAIPAVYNRERTSAVAVPDHLRPAIDGMRAADLALFCCARMMWVRDPRFSEAEWSRHSKNSDWLFRGLAELVAAHPGLRPLLTVVEYGPDVAAARRLVQELGIGAFVRWLPIMPRREIMLLLAAADVGVGEFYIDPGVIWGGTGWEVLASGKPLLQSFNFTCAGFQAELGHPPPPILDVRSPGDVARHLARLHASKELCGSIGRESADWFDRHNGIGLARRWLGYLTATERRAFA